MALAKHPTSSEVPHLSWPFKGRIELLPIAPGCHFVSEVRTKPAKARGYWLDSPCTPQIYTAHDPESFLSISAKSTSGCVRADMTIPNDGFLARRLFLRDQGPSVALRIGNSEAPVPASAVGDSLFKPLISHRSLSPTQVSSLRERS